MNYKAANNKLYAITRVPNPTLPGPGTKIHVRQCHHSNQRIRFYTYRTTLGFGLLGLTAHNLHLPPQSSAIPPPPRHPVQTDSQRPLPPEAGAVLTARTPSSPRDARSLANTPDTRPIRNICCQINFALYYQRSAKFFVA